MNIINIMIKEIKHNIRDKKGMVMMILFPVILMLVLGAALSGAFETSKKIGEIKALYLIQGEKLISESFKSFLGENKNSSITFVEALSIEEGLSSVQDTKYNAFVLVKENEEKIYLYKNDRYNLEASIVEAVLNSYVQRYNVIGEILKVNPMALDQIGNIEYKDYVTEVSLIKKRAPRAIDFYAVTMLTLIIMYASIGGGWAIKGEKIRKTGNRIVASPIKKYEIFIGKTLGALVSTFLQISIVIIVSKFILKAYWGSDMITIFILIISEIIMAISIGITVGFAVKSETTMNGILNTLIPFVVFLGGGYMPLESFGNGILLKLANISPLKWTNDAILQVIYDNSRSLVSSALAINLAISIILILLSAYIFKREAI
jgi:ABC-2 type transport system permease protein